MEKVDDEALAVTVARNGVSRRSVLVSKPLLGLTPAPAKTAAGGKMGGRLTRHPVSISTASLPQSW